jgi:hypothetical protein
VKRGLNLPPLAPIFVMWMDLPDLGSYPSLAAVMGHLFDEEEREC